MGFRKYKAETTVSAQNQWTDTITPCLYNDSGRMNISVRYNTASRAPIVRLQRSFDGGATWGTVKKYGDSTENQLVDHEGAVIYRLGVDTGEFGADTTSVYVRLST